MGILDCERYCIIVNYSYIDVTGMMTIAMDIWTRSHSSILQSYDFGVHRVRKELSNRLLTVDYHVVRWFGSWTSSTTYLNKRTHWWSLVQSMVSYGKQKTKLWYWPYAICYACGSQSYMGQEYENNKVATQRQRSVRFGRYLLGLVTKMLRGCGVSLGNGCLLQPCKKY